MRLFPRMHEKLKSIADQFHDKNTGFNDNMRTLMEHYLSTENFLDRNYIIYDIFPGSKSLTDLFTDGLLTSYGSSKFLGGKLQYFSSSTLNKLMFAGNEEDIRKLYYRYELENMKYGPDDDSDHSFISSLSFALDDYPSLVANYEKYVLVPNEYFWDKYAEIIHNSLVLLGIIKFNASTINSVSSKLISFFEKQKHLHAFKLLKCLRFFIFQKRSDLSPESLREYFILALKNDFFHSDNYIETLVDILNFRKIKISLFEEEFNIVKEQFLSDERLDSQTESWFSLGYIFNAITSAEHKAEIKNFAVKSLKRKMEYGKYYLACMFDIIEPTAQFTPAYFKQVEEIVLKGQQKSFFDKRDYYRDSRIDNFFNFCLKYNIEMPVEIKNHLPKLGAYYGWLNDMDNFEYTAFNTEWLTTHFTLYFKRKYRKSAALKNHLLDVIKHEANKEVERIFILTYSFDD